MTTQKARFLKKGSEASETTFGIARTLFWKTLSPYSKTTQNKKHTLVWQGSLGQTLFWKTYFHPQQLFRVHPISPGLLYERKSPLRAIAKKCSALKHHWSSSTQTPHAHVCMYSFLAAVSSLSPSFPMLAIFSSHAATRDVHHLSP